jgi:hypothetical protein
MAFQLVSALKALRSVPALRERVDVLGDRVASLAATAERAADHAEAAARLAEDAHQALVRADPAQALDIVTATRDELRRLSVDLTEQLNRLSAEVASASLATAPATDQGQLSGSS